VRREEKRREEKREEKRRESKWGGCERHYIWGGGARNLSPVRITTFFGLCPPSGIPETLY
jgi:hypothetical protein